jgi:hypothetical protein
VRNAESVSRKLEARRNFLLDGAAV